MQAPFIQKGGTDVPLICHAFHYDSMPRGVKKGVSEKKFDRTVRKIKRSGGTKNPYAVANAKLGRKGKSTKGKRKSRK
jgi:hypothetical protein